MPEPSPEVAAFLDDLRSARVVVEVRPDGSIGVPPRGARGPSTELDFPEGLLVDYLDQVARGYAPFDDDPRARARGLVAVQIAGQLHVDHGGGVNLVRRLGLLRGEAGLRLVEERIDDASPPGGLPDGPHDEPEVFEVELRVLADSLRRRDLDVRVDVGAATLWVGPAGRGPDAHEVEVVLRPDLLRAHLEAQEAEYAEILDDPRPHAFRALCQRIGYLLTDDHPPAVGMRRLAVEVSAAGATVLAPQPPPEGPLVWSAEPGRRPDEPS